MKDHLEQNISQLLTKQSLVLEIDSLDDFAGLLDEIAFNGFVGLFSVPRAAALASEKSYYIDEIAETIELLLLIFNH